MKVLPIIKYRKIWYTFSSILVLASLATIILIPANFGIDFTGGTLMEYRFEERPSNDEVRKVLKSTEEELNAEVGKEGTKVDFGSPVVQPSGESNTLIRIRTIENETHLAIQEAFIKAFGENTVEERYEVIGPVVGRSLKKKAITALLLAIVFIILFIAIAFRKIPRQSSPLRFGMTAVLALIHDVLIIVGVFMVLGMTLNVEVDSLFITALLTVMGFSVHDTIVVFDRVRENLIKNRNASFEENANLAVNQTITRSINTSITTVFTLAALFVLGGVTIKWFVLAMLLGILVGTYSSIFLATPILVSWHMKKRRA